MGKYRYAARVEAINRGMRFIYETACDPDNFAEYGSNFLYFFNFVASTSADPELRRMARRMARERFSHWQSERAMLPDGFDAATVTDFVLGSNAAQRIGIRDSALKLQLKEAAKQFTPEEYLWFDPHVEPPPVDIPEVCDCGMMNERGRRVCRRRNCKRPLQMMSRYKVWCVAFTTAYCGERYGVTLGARYADVMQWLPAMRPFRGRENGANPDFFDSVYAITHVVYTLNDYGIYNLSARWLPHEFAFLKENLHEAIAMDDPDMVGEFLDSLMSFGLKDTHTLLRTGMSYLLSKQNADGSWGSMEDVPFSRYHPTWTAIDGLREYRWRGVGLRFPKLLPLLEQWAKH